MEEKELSVQEINEVIQESKKIVKNNAAKGIHIIITAMKKNVDKELGPYFNENNLKSKNRLEIIDLFNDAIDTLMSNANYVRFKCIIKSSNNVKLLFDREITIRPGQSAVYVYSPERTSVEKEDLSDTKKESFNKAIYQVLGLMGFDQEHLDGVAHNEYEGFGAVMAIRERNLENRILQAEKDRKSEEVLAEKVKLESRVESLNKELEDERKYSEELEDKIEDLNGQIEELNKLKPESSFLGTSLVAALTKAGTNLAIKHADVIGGLAGVSREEMVDMLRSAEMPPQSAQAQSDVDVDVETVGKHSEQISAIDKFLNQLSDENFDAVWALMTAFSKDQTLISKALQSISNE